jgi:hypothetical protein
MMWGGGEEYKVGGNGYRRRDEIKRKRKVQEEKEVGEGMLKTRKYCIQKVAV